MSENMKILLLSASVGSGHTRAAQAVSEALQARPENVSTEVANIFHYVYPAVGRLVLGGYLFMIHHFPVAYKYLYRWGNTSRRAVGGRNALSGYLGRKIELLVKYYQPAVIVCTHASPAGAVAYLKRRGRLTVPVAAVITDFVVHRLWVYPELERYFVANEDMRRFLQQQGISGERITVAGIPIQGKFTAATALSADALPIILLMGGGAGVLPLADMVAALDDLPQPFAMVAVAGHNAALREKLVRLSRQCRHGLTVYGFVNNVSELMQRASFIITKPGGLTSAEALASGLPMLIFRPIPGQEEANTRYLTQCNAARRVDGLAALVRGVQYLLTDGAALTAMRHAALREGKPAAAAAIAAALLDMTRYNGRRK